jgi:branched-subunit amino acid aminotransferase/4-amino-4-deoxychorismate lyase
MYGDAVYTTLKVSTGGAVFLDRHLNRLTKHMQRLLFGKFNIPFDLRTSILELIKENALSEGLVRITVSRGMQFNFPSLQTQEPFIFSFCVGRPVSVLPALNVVTRQDTRDGFRDIKSVNRLIPLFALREAKLAGADEAVFCEGLNLIEATGNNIIGLDTDNYTTPDLTDRGMAGIVREVLMEGLPIRLADIQESGHGMLFLTNSLSGVIPVRSINGRMLLQDDVVLKNLRIALESVENDELCKP